MTWMKDLNDIDKQLETVTKSCATLLRGNNQFDAEGWDRLALLVRRANALRESLWACNDIDKLKEST